MKKKECFEAEEYKMCEYCIMAKSIKDSEFVVCGKYGLKNVDDVCRRFKINLLAIEPKKLRNLNTTLSEEDFKL